MTIEHYFIAQKIERVKELLLYNELTLSEIAYQLHTARCI
jgi:AraC-like DNA-binding protein